MNCTIEKWLNTGYGVVYATTTIYVFTYSQNEIIIYYPRYNIINCLMIHIGKINIDNHNDFPYSILWNTK